MQLSARKGPHGKLLITRMIRSRKPKIRCRPKDPSLYRLVHPAWITKPRPASQAETWLITLKAVYRSGRTANDETPSKDSPSDAVSMDCMCCPEACNPSLEWRLHSSFLERILMVRLRKSVHGADSKC